MLTYFIVFSVLGYAITKIVSDDKKSIVLIVILAILWGLKSRHIWGLVALGEMFLGYGIAKYQSSKIPHQNDRDRQ